MTVGRRETLPKFAQSSHRKHASRRFDTSELRFGALGDLDGSFELERVRAVSLIEQHRFGNERPERVELAP